jgi:nitrogen regulatory protein PII
MKSNQYILFIVINDIKSFKSVRTKLNQMEMKDYTVLDTMGATSLFDNGTRYSNLMTGMMHNDNKKYNKTIFLTLPSEENAEQLMDEIGEILHYDVTKPGKGIMFTVPIYKSVGIG